jgi:hypothetical protein
VTKNGTPVCWDPAYLKSGKRQRVEIEKIEDGMALTLGRASSMTAARRWIRGASPGVYRIVLVTHEAVATVKRRAR